MPWRWCCWGGIGLASGDDFFALPLALSFIGALWSLVIAEAAKRGKLSGAMREGLAVLNAQWATQGLEPFANGVGLRLGDVVVGPIGSEARKDFTVIGDAVNTASRLEGLCKDKGCRLIISDAVFERLGANDRSRFRDLGHSTVKGRQESMQLWGGEPS